MKVIKEKKDKGYIITVLIGNHGQNSYWTSPPIYGIDNHHYNFEKQYLVGRYPMINTKEKAKTFSRLYKNLWVEVTPYQLDLMKHCIGLDYKKKPYRNRYQTQAEDEGWNDLVKKGLAKMSDNIADNGLTWFWLTQQGVEYVLGKSVSKKVYEDL
ncbi:hypothetical protein [Clostridium peptidivorans]|uniref:hypothetical protein n=1 Tax=Clostridium peptidivorans TaxID=100174 RepID=UPI000BE3CBAB|nr:hypothetical protein [Clostridium peptidivorans]